MQFRPLLLVALRLLQVSGEAAVRSDLKGGVQVVELEPQQTFDPNAKEIQAKMSPDSEVEIIFRCTAASGKQLTLSTSKRFVGCCLPEQSLVGTPDTQFLCCGAGHDIAGNQDVGFSCCPNGQVFDGKVCAPPTHCENGKTLVDGKCVCPKGSKEKDDGTCDFGECSSGISYGKCYSLIFPNGQILSSDTGGTYYAIAPDINHGRAVLQFCKDEKCESAGPINPGNGFNAKDLRGIPANGHNPGQWLGNDRNGGHVSRKSDFKLAGNFTITKWYCGKYCLGGLEWGLSYACPSSTPAMTFWEFDKFACIDVNVIEVPCDTDAAQNNCAWNSDSDQCCDKLGCAERGFPQIANSASQQPLS